MSSPFQHARRGVDDLTRKQVLDLLEDGLSFRAVEHKLGISKSTVHRIARDAGWQFPHEQTAEAARVRAARGRDRRTAMANVVLDEVQRAVDRLQAAESIKDFGFAARAVSDLSRSHVELARLDVGLADRQDTEDVVSMMGELRRALVRVVEAEDADNAADGADAPSEGGARVADHGSGRSAGHGTAAS